MQKTSTFLLSLSLLLIIPATISTTERKSAKTMVANYLNSGGKMILHSEDGSKELNLLKHFQGLSELYQGKINNQDIKKFSNISYCKWLTILPSDYTELLKLFFTYKYSAFKDAMVSNTFQLPQELSNKIQEHLAWDEIKELYRLQADKKRQKNYPMGYLPILLLKSFFLCNCYQADLIKFDVQQHEILFAIGFSEFAYVNLMTIFASTDFCGIHTIIVLLSIVNLVLMCYNGKGCINLVSFLQSIIGTINLGVLSYQSKKHYDACNKKINTMTIQGVKRTEIVDELQSAMQLLQNHQDTVLACYQGEPFNKMPGVNSATTEVENVGSIIAQHIDPSIKPDHITLNLLTDENESSVNDFEYDRAHCFDNCCGRAIDIIVPSCAWTACLGVFIQRYFSS